MAIQLRIDDLDQFGPSHLLGWVGDTQVAGGLCRLLSINWLVECLRRGAPAPNDVLHLMKAQGKPYFSRLAAQQEGYTAAYSADRKGWLAALTSYLATTSEQRLRPAVTSVNMHLATGPSDITQALAWATQFCNTRPRACLIGLGNALGNHCVAAIEPLGAPAGSWHVFDPNHGVMVAHPQGAQDVGALLHTLHRAYNIGWARVLPVSTR